jgi:hypothetical protein
MLSHILLNLKEFRPRVHPELSKKILRALPYQSLTKAEEGLTRGAKRIIETIRFFYSDEGQTQKDSSIWVPRKIISNRLSRLSKTIHTHIQLIHDVGHTYHT